MIRLGLVAILCATTFPAFLNGQLYHGASGQATFLGEPIILTTNNASSAIGAYDFNHDGNLDILSQNYLGIGAGTVSVLFGDGKGHFTQGPASPVSPGGSTQVADMNGDGIPDIVYANGSSNIYIAYGEAGGTFQNPVAYPVSFPPVGASASIAVADLNGDGLNDLVFAGDAGWQALLNTGSGFVQSQQFLLTNTGGTQSPGVALGDLNGDGKIDFVYSTEGGVRVYLGKGNGTFGPATFAKLPNPLPLQWGPVALADWSGDGKLDLLVYGPGIGNTFYRLEGNGDGTFQKGVEMQSPSAGAQFLVADFNGDGIPDIGVNGNDYFVVFPGTGAGAFASPYTYPVGWGGYGIPFGGAVAGSFRNDGRIDIATGVLEGMALLFNTGIDLEGTPEITASGAYAIATADINGDGNPDLITLSGSGVQVFWGTGKALAPFMAGPLTATAGCADGNASCFTLGDFNGDGYLDVAFTPDGLSIVVLPGDGKGNFGAPVSTSLAGLRSKWLAAGDMNGDGKLDLVVSSGFPEIMLGNGDGTFQPPIPTTTQSTPPLNAPARLADLNGDGRLDIFGAYLVAAGEPGEFVLLNQGGGTFSAPAVYQGAGISDVAECDVNGDGIPDIVGAGPYGDPYPNVLLGNGNGTFTALHSPSGNFFEASALVCGAFTGKTSFGQIAMASGYDSGIEIFKGAKSGQPVLSPIGWGTDLGPMDIVAGKFHGKSAVDDLAVLNGNGTISILINVTP